jgi:hypothetical protein
MLKLAERRPVPDRILLHPARISTTPNAMPRSISTARPRRAGSDPRGRGHHPAAYGKRLHRDPFPSQGGLERDFQCIPIFLEGPRHECSSAVQARNPDPRAWTRMGVLPESTDELLIATRLGALTRRSPASCLPSSRSGRLRFSCPPGRSRRLWIRQLLRDAARCPPARPPDLSAASAALPQSPGPTSSCRS